MSPPEDTATTTIAGERRSLAGAPVVVEVRNLYKTFRVPHERVDSFKERAAHPFARRGHRALHALADVSFDVRQGEFFGIVGRNGSGKSSLLKIMASIYRADAGSVRVAGRLAPFIELGVGFNPELTSRENVVLNGVLMGLGRREARRRLDEVLDFADLREFADLKLKNYSSGMMVRLAFAVMVEADADVMLIDEVLAVGDAAFAQKCLDVFREKRRAGRTIVLVTHDMATVQSFCDRAMLIHDGEMRYLGDPEEAALRYFRLNFQGDDRAGPQGAAGVPDVNARLIDAWVENADGERVTSIEQGEPIGMTIVVEARHELVNPVFGLHFLDADGVQLFGFNRTLELGDDVPDRLEAGQRVRIHGRIENPLLPGRYFANLWISRNRSVGDLALHVLRLLDFVVYGTQPGPGRISVEADVQADLESEDGP
jgi:ABC-type polysaccharide/polyol phosphate transport system ATPase subunit